ncbi:MAG: MurT ligase domain-containing protein [Microbacteriaceae bacterium]
MSKKLGLRYVFPILLGRLARAITRARGGGSAFPGYLVNRLAPSYLSELSQQVADGVVFVLGSNGKSTTTHMISELVRAHGLSVFTNPTGANLPQGVTSALLSEVDFRGVLAADVAILEVDEAFAVGLAKTLRPSVVTMLNVQVDQLFRFYETERVADMMINTAILSSGSVVTNREDPYLSKVSKKMAGSVPVVHYFGAADEVLSASAHGLANADDFRDPESMGSIVAESEVLSWKGLKARIALGDETLDIALPARGLHYAVDAAAALQTAKLVLGQRFDSARAIEAFRVMRPAYGRGELLKFGSEEVEMTMFKNGASLQLNLDAFEKPPEQVLLAIDEGTPDISWIYDVDFGALDHVDVISGEKCWQVALRLEHAGIPVHHIEPELKRGIDIMRALPAPKDGRKAWIVNYEQMMYARKLLGQGDMEISR